MKTVVVGMSGGVDSSVSAYLLKQQGYDVIGLFMKNWEEKDGDGVCQSSKEFEDVARVCEHIGIPYYSVNFVKEYWDNVFQYFLDELRQGYTPNPDILCNREIKFKALMDKALELGAHHLATGHYCRTQNGLLLRGSDPNKDQSYFLYTAKSTVLNQVLFPIGDMIKTDLRALARKYGIPTAEKKDSTGICFIGKRDFKEFVGQYIAYQPGNFETPEGKVVGKHDGVAFYTIGQRKGLGVGGAGDAWFVVGKDIPNNVVYIAQGENHPSLFASTLVATDLSWVSEAPIAPFRCTAKIRYRHADQPCTIDYIRDGSAHVTFDSPQRAITPRQSVVFYKDEVCLGGGMIQPKV